MDTVARLRFAKQACEMKINKRSLKTKLNCEDCFHKKALHDTFRKTIAGKPRTYASHAAVKLRHKLHTLFNPHKLGEF